MINKMNKITLKWIYLSNNCLLKIIQVNIYRKSYKYQFLKKLLNKKSPNNRLELTMDLYQKESFLSSLKNLNNANKLNKF